MASNKLSVALLLCAVVQVAISANVIYRLHARDLPIGGMVEPSTFINIYEDGTQRWNTVTVENDANPDYPGVFEIDTLPDRLLAFEVRSNGSTRAVLGWSYMSSSSITMAGNYSALIALDGRSAGNLTLAAIAVTP